MLHTIMIKMLHEAFNPLFFGRNASSAHLAIFPNPPKLLRIHSNRDEGAQMTIQLTIDLPKDVFFLLRKSPTEFVGEMRLAAAVKWYQLEMISQSRAAELAG